MTAISVVMPVFNRAERVPRAVASVLAQDHADFELVIVDDASTDDTVAVIEGFDDPRICLLHPAGGGVDRKWAPGAEEVTGSR